MTTVEITTEDILSGVKVNCYSCPVAKAIKRHLKEGVSVAVTHTYVKLTNDFHQKAIILPDAVQKFITGFDLGETVAPFKFDLDIPAELLAWPSPNSA